MGFENSGRRPKPTALKVLRGVTRRDRLNPLEPRPPAGEVVKPEGLSPAASGVWDELAPLALAMGTLTRADVRPFATLCELQATFQAAVLVKGAEGQARVERDTAAALRPYYSEFGLTPVARARIAVPKTKVDEPVSKWAGALK